MPTIVGIAESYRYLVGRYDDSNNFVGIASQKQVEIFDSLVAAKQYLRKRNILTAALEFRSPYDEMCGTPVAKHLELIHL